VKPVRDKEFTISVWQSIPVADENLELHDGTLRWAGRRAAATRANPLRGSNARHSETQLQTNGYNVSAWGSSEEELMSQVIPDKYRDLFSKRAFASLGTLMPDGTPQVTPVWVDLDGDLVVVNTAKGRQKDRNMRRDPRVSLAIIDPDNPYRYLEIRGRVAEITEQGADAHIDKMAKKYLGADKYPYRQASETRVMYKIQPERANVMG